MPYTYPKDGDTYTILMPHEVQKLPLLLPATEVTQSLGDLGDLKGPEYKYKDLQDHTFRMMRLLMINYTSNKNKLKIEDISEEDRKRCMPFAYFLAMIDGNSFTGCIDQYIPEVHSILTMEGKYEVVHTLARLNAYPGDKIALENFAKKEDQNASGE